MSITSQTRNLEEDALEVLFALSGNESRKTIPIVQIDTETNRPVITVHRRLNSAKNDNEYFSRWRIDNYEKCEEDTAVSQPSKTKKVFKPPTDSYLSRSMPSKMVRFCKEPTLRVENYYFCHFDNIREYLAQYKECVTLPTILEHNKGGYDSAKANVCSTCSQEYSTYDLVRQCQCSVPSKSSKLSSYARVGYVCYEYSDRNGSHSNNISRDDKRVNYNCKNIAAKQRVDGAAVKNAIKDSAKITSAEAKSKRKWLLHDKNYSKTFCHSMAIHSRAASSREFLSTQKRRSQVLKSNCASEQAVLRILPDTKNHLGPRMGSNHPPSLSKAKQKDSSVQSRLLKCLRPKIPQAAFPHRRKQFQACIMPMCTSPSNSF